MAQMETPMQAEAAGAHQAEEEQAGPMLLERLQVRSLAVQVLKALKKSHKQSQHLQQDCLPERALVEFSFQQPIARCYGLDKFSQRRAA